MNALFSRTSSTASRIASRSRFQRFNFPAVYIRLASGMPEHNIPKARVPRSSIVWKQFAKWTLVERPFPFEDECLLCQWRMGKGQVREDL